jgi:hypothetical protein
MCSNIPAAPAYGVFISQLIQYSRACGSYHVIHIKLIIIKKIYSIKLKHQNRLNKKFIHFKLIWHINMICVQDKDIMIGTTNSFEHCIAWPTFFLRFKASDFLFGILKLFFQWMDGWFTYKYDMCSRQGHHDRNHKL